MEHCGENKIPYEIRGEVGVGFFVELTKQPSEA
jgi:hypothetical protein